MRFLLLVSSILVETMLLGWVAWLTYQWSAGARDCQIGLASSTLPYCRSFWAFGGPWALVSAVIPVGWAALALNHRRR